MSRLLRFFWLLGGLVACAVSQAQVTDTHQTIPSQNSAFMSDLQRFLRREDANRFQDVRPGFVVQDCAHGISVTTTTPAVACTAYTSTGIWLTQVALQIVYSGGDGVYWLAAHEDTTTPVTGWTRVPGSQYLWIIAATKPVIPESLVLLQRSVVSGGAITVVEDVSIRRVTRNRTLTVNTTIGAGGTWVLESTALLTLDPGVTLTVKGCIEAGISQIFTGAGLVRYAADSPCTTVHPEWWGAINTGGTVAQQAFFKLASDALALGGTLLGAGPGAHYYFNDVWRIHASNFTFDGQNALFTGDVTGGSGTFPVMSVHDDCTQSCSGETSQFRRNVHLRNYRVGTTGLFPADQMRGGILHGCEDCSITNVVVMSSRGTTFTTFRCQRCVLRDLTIVSGLETSPAFSILLVHSNDCLVENIHSRGATATTGAFPYVIQMKGGINNTFRKITIIDHKNPTVAVGQQSIWSRGDDPWSTSPTDPNLDPYPFLTNPQMPAGQTDCKLFNCYTAPDSRRASIDTKWLDIYIRSGEGPHQNGMTIQEASGDIVDNITIEDAWQGIVIAQGTATGAGERNFTITNCNIRRIGLTRMDTAGSYGIYLNGAGSLSVDGETTAVNGFRGTRISNCVIQNTSGPAINVEYASDATLTNNTVLNAAVGTATTDDFGIWVPLGSKDIKLIGNRVDDNQATPTLATGIRVNESNILPTVIGNTVSCPNCVFGTFNFIRAFPVGRIAENSPAFCTARTTTATPDVTRCVLLTKAGDIFRLKASCNARQGTTNRAYYERTALIEELAGVVTVYPNTGTGDITFESDAAWDMDIVASGNEARPRLTGGAGQTIDWYCDMSIIPMIQ